MLSDGPTGATIPPRGRGHAFRVARVSDLRDLRAMRTIWAILCLTFALPLASLGCGGSSGSNIIGGTGCGVGPCGGDLIGTWNATGACVDKGVVMATFVSGLMGRCSGATLADTTAFTPSGTLTFKSDMTYDMALTLNGAIGVNVPTSCFPGATCAQFGVALQSAVAGDKSIQSVSCAGNCVCTFVQAPESDVETGTYTISGSSLVTTEAGQTTAESVGYCVKGTTATFNQPAMTMSTGIEALVATKS
jgi:hypothetical protein